MATPDELAVEQAEPVERAEIDSNPYEQIGASLPGSTAFEHGRGWMIGNENNALQGIGQLPASYDEDGGIENASGVSMGAVASVDVGLMTDAMTGLLPNPIQPFTNVTPGYDVGKNDAMQGITSGAVPGTLLDEKMYIGDGNMPVDVFEAGNVEPEIANE